MSTVVDISVLMGNINLRQFLAHCGSITTRESLESRLLYALLFLSTIGSPVGYNPAEHVFSYTLRYLVGFSLVEMAISTNQKPIMIYRKLYEYTGPGLITIWSTVCTNTITLIIRHDRDIQRE